MSFDSSTMRKWVGIIALLALVVGLLAFGKPFKIIGLFVTSGLAVGSLYALGGMGIVVLFRTTGVLNFANGAIGAIAVMIAWQFDQWGVYVFLTWVICIGIGLILSVFYGRMVAPLLADRDPVVKAVASLGFALILLGVANFVWNDDPRKFGLPSDGVGIQVLGLRVTLTRLIAFSASLCVIVGINFYLAHTAVGLQMRSLANDRDLSALLGIPILRVETIAWAISGALAGFTGLMFGNLIQLEPSVITFMVIPCFAAAVCGQLKSLSVVLFGGLAIGMLESLLTLSPQLKSVRAITPFVVAAMVMIWSQRGRRLTFSWGH